ncbi:hypothetical protein [Corynebacterium aquilae]|uniref:hypothetical protein n=1 Tax=Corynebacterium aquilae TaxID=203263 RepID=UPI001B808244|nr:hypothetical protein [Corynebacterium aquilae]
MDGNKRTGWAACWLLIRLNAAIGPLQGEVDPDAAEELVLNVSAGKLDVPSIADLLRNLVSRQLHLTGHHPPGYEITSLTEVSENATVGIAQAPDGEVLFYIGLTSEDGTPLELFQTPEQAKQFIAALLAVLTFPQDWRVSYSVPVRNYMIHNDLNERPEGL